MRKLRRLGLPIYSVIVYALLLAPIAIVIIVSFNASEFVSFPPKSLSVVWYKRALLNEEFISAFSVSALVACITTGISMVIGTMAALAFVRYKFFGRNLLRSLSVARLAFPQVVLGLALLQYFINIGYGLGTRALILGHVLVTLPFVVQIVAATLYGFDRSLEEAARMLGAGPVRTFLRITVPIIRPGVLTAGILTFILSFDNVGISLFISDARSMTIPVRLFLYVQENYDPSIAAISTVLIAFAVVLVLILARLGTLERVFRGRG